MTSNRKDFKAGAGAGAERGTGGGGKGTSGSNGYKGFNSGFKGPIAHIISLDYKAHDTHFPPEKTESFLEQFSTYCSTTFVMGLAGVFEVEGDYPDYPMPDDPEEGAGTVAMKKWAQAFETNGKYNRKLAEDKPKLFSAMWAQMSPSSQERIKRNPGGRACLVDKCPLSLVLLIRATHSSGGRNDTGENHQIACQRYYDLRMGEHENLTQFYEKFMATLNGYLTALTQDERGEIAPNDIEQARTFIHHLNSKYGRYKVEIDEGIRKVCDTVAEVYENISQFYKITPEQAQARVFSTRFSSGSRDAQGRVLTREKGSCGHCGVMGHYAKSCPERSAESRSSSPHSTTSDIDDAVREERKSGLKRPAGKQVNY